MRPGGGVVLTRLPEFFVLGPLRATEGGRELELGSRKQRSVLALLLIHVNRVVSTDQMLEWLWGDDAEGKHNSLWVYISRLRSILEPEREKGNSELLVTRDHGYMLLLDTESIDAVRFTRLAEQGRATLGRDPREAAEVLRHALDLWTGAAYQEFAYEDFCQGEIARLDELRIRALEDRIDADMRSGASSEVVIELEQLQRAQPYRERPVSLLMRALYRAGRQVDALLSFERFRHTLADEVGVDPSPELRRLEEQVLLHDVALRPSLDDHSPRGAPTPATNPFRGLEAFREHDAPHFFGRDRLVAAIMRRLGDRRSMVALVGASGSGKSSAVRAGLIPALRKGAVEGAEDWLIAQMVPGSRPFAELEAALLRSTIDAPDSFTEQLRDDGGIVRAVLRILPDDAARLLLVIDQFEELFTLVESDDERRRFLAGLGEAMDDPHGRIAVVVTLRADFYDRPLSHPAFARRLDGAVINVVEMTPDELEEAAKRPAAQAGVSLESALLATLIAEVADQPGALPLFEYTLTELFERRVNDVLTAADYRDMGGVRGALRSTAEELHSTLDEEQAAAAHQLFLRLVSIADTEEWTRRRVTAAEVLSLAIDVVALQRVLDLFGRRRLLTFDRDQVTGAPTVEVAHEALLHEWDRLRGWISDGRDDVVRNARLASAADEWRSAGRNPDFLLTGERLDQYDAWAVVSTMVLTTDEREYVDASLAQREQRRARERDRAAREDQLRRTARRGRWGVAAAVVVLAAVGLAALIAALAPEPARVALLFRGEGDQGMNDMLAAGLSQAADDFGVNVEQVVPLVDVETELRRLAAAGYDMVVVSPDFDTPVDAVAGDHPDTWFVAVDEFAVHGSAENVVAINFGVNDSAFLAGAAAAMTSRSGAVGFIGGSMYPPTEAQRAGFEAGAAFARPDIDVRSLYLGPFADQRFTANRSPDDAAEAATRLFEDGADVVFHATGQSGLGVMRVARDLSTQDRHLWVIGSDTNQFLQVAPTIQPHVLTSAFKRFDTAVYDAVARLADERIEAGLWNLTLADAGVDYSTSGGFLDDIGDELGGVARQIEAGDAVAPGMVTSPPEWQRAADVSVHFEVRSDSCPLDGEQVRDDADTLQWSRGDVVEVVITNTTSEPAGFSVWTVHPDATLADIRVEARTHIPTLYDEFLAATVIAPGGSSSVALEVDGPLGALHCFLPLRDEGGDIPAALYSAGS